MAATGAGASSGVASMTPLGPSIAIQPGVTYQTMLGWEATAEIAEPTNSDADFYRTEVLDRIVNELGINRVRLEIRSGNENSTDWWQDWVDGTIPRSTWSANRYTVINDNADPNVINAAGFFFSELDWIVDTIVNPMRVLVAANGEQLYINLCVVNREAGTLHETTPAEFGEFVLAEVQHINTKYGWVPDAVEIILEPDLPGFTWNGTKMGDAIVAIDARLTAAGFTNVDIVAPSTVNMGRASTYFDDIIAVPGALSAMSEISYHRYPPGVTIPNLEAIATRATANNLHSAMLEFIGADYHMLHEDITVGLNSSWQQFTMAQALPSTGASDDGAKYYVIDDTVPSAPIVSMGWRTRYLLQYMKYVRRGAVRHEATSTDGGLEPVAFRNLNGVDVVVAKATTGASFSVSGLPAGTYGRSYSTSAEENTELGDVSIASGGEVPASIPLAGVVTVYRQPPDVFLDLNDGPLLADLGITGPFEFPYRRTDWLASGGIGGTGAVHRPWFPGMAGGFSPFTVDVTAPASRRWEMSYWVRQNANMDAQGSNVKVMRLRLGTGQGIGSLLSGKNGDGGFLWVYDNWRNLTPEVFGTQLPTDDVFHKWYMRFDYSNSSALVFTFELDDVQIFTVTRATEFGDQWGPWAHLPLSISPFCEEYSCGPTGCEAFVNTGDFVVDDFSYTEL